MRIGALITAAGSGTRFNRGTANNEAKQFLELRAGERLVDRTVATASAVSDWVGVIIPAERAWDGPSVDHWCGGGASRYESLSIGLLAVPADVGIVLVHSASHPLATVGLANRLIEAVKQGADGAVPFLPAVDVIKRRDEGGRLTTVGREGLGSAQCPMAFDRAMLDRAFAETTGGTEESQLVEAVGGVVVAVAGEVSNIHVIDEAGLAVARAIEATVLDHHQPSG